MFNKGLKFIAVATLFVFTACTHDGLNQYSARDVGKPTTVEFGTVITYKQVAVKGENTGLGGIAGGALGGVAGSNLGKGNGQAVAAVGGVIAGAVAGALAEQALADRQGIEYVITKEDGKTITIVQNIAKNETAIAAGSRVMIQTSGSYQRVIPADSLPETIKRPKSIKVTD